MAKSTAFSTLFAVQEGTAEADSIFSLLKTAVKWGCSHALISDRALTALLKSGPSATVDLPIRFIIELSPNAVSLPEDVGSDANQKISIDGVVLRDFGVDSEPVLRLAGLAALGSEPPLLVWVDDECCSLAGEPQFELSTIARAVPAYFDLFVEQTGFKIVAGNFLRKTMQMEDAQSRFFSRRRLVLRRDLLPKIDELAAILQDLIEQEKINNVGSVDALYDAIVYFAAALPCPRTYISKRFLIFPALDRAVIEETCAALQDISELEVPAVLLVASVLLAPWADRRRYSSWYRKLDFISAFQELTSMLERECSHRTSHLALPFFHLATDRAQAIVNQPPLSKSDSQIKVQEDTDGLVTTDMHARIEVLSEISQQWLDTLQRWQNINNPHVRKLGTQRVPDRYQEFLFYQMLVASWPVDGLSGGEPAREERLRRLTRQSIDYLSLSSVFNAAGAEQTPAEEVSSALEKFVTAAMFGATAPVFIEDLSSFVKFVLRAGLWNSLSRVVFHLTAPGIPLISSADKSWRFGKSDATSGARRFSEGADERKRGGWLSRLLEQPESGLIKELIVSKTISLRQALPSLFSDGTMQRLEVEGSLKKHVMAFLRSEASEQLLVVVPRFFLSMPHDSNKPPIGKTLWRDTAVLLPSGCERSKWQSIYLDQTLTVGELPFVYVGEVLLHLPVAVFRRRVMPLESIKER